MYEALKSDIALEVLEFDGASADTIARLGPHLHDAQSAKSLFVLAAECSALRLQLSSNLRAKIRAFIEPELHGIIGNFGIQVLSSSQPSAIIADALAEIMQVTRAEDLLRLIEDAEGELVTLLVETYESKLVSAPGLSTCSSSKLFSSSKAKDKVRSSWASRVSARFSQYTEDERARMQVFSLFGFPLHELPIYRSLGIPDEHMHAAEFQPAVQKRMKRSGFANVFHGNCYAYAAAHPEMRFDIMNIDLFGRAEEFFQSGEWIILKLLADRAALSLTTRIRQDGYAVSMGKALLREMENSDPALEEVIIKLFELKQRLFRNRSLAHSMVAREVYLLKNLLGALPTAKHAIAAMDRTTYFVGGTSTMQTWSFDIEKGKAAPKPRSREILELLRDSPDNVISS